ncbi:hypothetical protein [Limnoglobus roseus]|uniref:HTH merR-type domain-containing protein n=1 Tax=Limnoglobus roseus TaxID=2598579 RepID=A0A5C1AB03_9BACT|nr:hypothetical protein [Limnoglobus roseus]QEL15900.1 hypothetical protein PX52LOC_02836 [Limnoglobus roseus]
MTTTIVPTLITPGVIAAEVGVPLHRVTHILATRPHIRPSARAGTLRLYDQAAVEAVRAEIERKCSVKSSRPALQLLAGSTS